MSKQTSGAEKKGIFDRFLSLIEWMGNLLPHPVMLFFWLCVVVVILGAVGATYGWSLADPRPDGTTGKAVDGMVRAKSLLSDEGLRWITTSLVKNFVNFAPLGTVLVALLGVGIAEHSGLISAAIRFLILRAPKNLVTMVLVFAGVLSNVASEIGYVVIIPMGAAIYYSLNRHPLAGLAAAFAGVSGGYSANLLLGTIDPLLSGLTEKAASSIDASYKVNPACNYYFLFASTFMVMAVGTWISLYIIEPRLKTYRAENATDTLDNQHANELTRSELRGLGAAGLTVILVGGLLVYLCVTPQQWDGLLKSKQEVAAAESSMEPGVGTSTQPASPSDAANVSASWPYMGVLGKPASGQKNAAFLEGVVALVFAGFLIPGIVYGVVTGSIKKDTDVINSMSKSMSSMGSYIVLVFFAAQFVEFFNWTNLGLLLAIQGSDFIRMMKLDNPAIFLLFIGLSAILNLLIGSASAKWAFMAPVFVPMLMGIGYSPELIQLAYRIGDSCTNVISPMMSYFGMIYVFGLRYDKDFKLGTLMSLMMPYAMIFLFVWTVFFYLWIFLLGLPIGPDSPLTYPVAV